jgi:hypothetical protein
MGQTMTRLRSLIELLGMTLCAGAFLLSPVPALATHDTDPKTKDQNLVISTDPAVNGRHLREAMAIGEDVLARLQSSEAAQDLPAIHKSLDRMYKTVRLALSGLREQKRRQRKFEDPLLEYEVTRTAKAWDTIRGPVDRYFNNPAPEVYIEGAIRDVRETITLLRPVVAVLP